MPSLRKHHAVELFHGLPGHYDRVGAVMSFGQDPRWRRALIDAAFAINEFAYGVLDAQGHRVVMEIEAGEKTDQDYRLEVVNPGGHSSRPVKNNAIYHLAAGLTRIGD